MARFKTLTDFYKSPEWITLRKRLMVERSTPEKGLLCQKCHEPILKDPECIAHHIIELTPINVNDVKISLNPNNILLVHQVSAEPPPRSKLGAMTWELDKGQRMHATLKFEIS